MAVQAPAIHPFSFAFAPEMIPPKNIETKATAVITHLTECSVKEVKDRIIDTTRLNDKAMTKMVVNPNKNGRKKSSISQFSSLLSK